MRTTAVFLAALGLASQAWAAPVPANNDTSMVAAPSTEEKRHAGGRCGFHVHIMLQGSKQHATVELKDGNQSPVGSATFDTPKGAANFGGAVSGLDKPVQVSVFASNANVVEFVYDGEKRGSGQEGRENENCKVGGRASGGFVEYWETLDLDCGFPC
ncbi:hypothetical protein PG985_000350 [Apiospora marii]|uniref:Uncharacterized protein n=1 Tax=Apiospora marii TaxID=335849 RepID=A0ABR1R1U7_9PEZI